MNVVKIDVVRRLFLVGVVGLSMALLGCSEPAPKFHATDVTGADWGSDFNLTDHTGKVRQLSDFKGKVVVLFFGYTQCPDVCPATLSAAAAALRILGSEADKVQVLFVTLDPARDTPALLAQYAPAFNPTFLGLYADEAGTEKAAKDFKVFYQKQPGATPGSYTIDHTAASYAYDPQGKLRLYIKHGSTPEEIAADLKLLLAGK